MHVNVLTLARAHNRAIVDFCSTDQRLLAVTRGLDIGDPDDRGQSGRSLGAAGDLEPQHRRARGVADDEHPVAPETWAFIPPEVTYTLAVAGDQQAKQPVLGGGQRHGLPMGLGMALAALPDYARPRPGDPDSPQVLIRTDAAGARARSPNQPSFSLSQ